MTAALLAFIHHAAAFMVFGTLLAELMLLRDPVTQQNARALLRMDTVYGISAAVLVIVGFIRVFYTEKGSGYYFSSVPFIAKISLFAIVGLISIFPTRKFLGWRKALASGAAPVIEPAQHRATKRIVHLELTLLVVIMFCAALMARGIGVVS